MKKAMYYVSPFVIAPVIYLTLTAFEGMEVLKSIAPYVLFAALFLFSVALGILSPTENKFDYIMTAAVPVSLLSSLFIALLLDEGCDGMPQFSIHHALNIEYYNAWLPIALVMTVITFVVSFKPLRNFVRNKFTFKKPNR